MHYIFEVLGQPRKSRKFRASKITRCIPNLPREYVHQEVMHLSAKKRLIAVSCVSWLAILPFASIGDRQGQSSLNLC